jgi:Spy/CpxP family protein refolding chaperone
MNKMKVWLLGGAVIATAALAVPMYLQADGDGHGRFGRGPGFNRMAGGGAPLISIALKHQSELKLTADQVANLEKTKSHYQSQIAPIQEKLRTLEGEIANLSQESKADLVNIKVKIQEAEKHRSELRYLRLEALENAKSILNAEQREQLKNLFASRRGEHRRHHGQAS